MAGVDGPSRFVAGLWIFVGCFGGLSWLDWLEGCCVLLVKPLLRLTRESGRIVKLDVTIARLQPRSFESRAGFERDENAMSTSLRSLQTDRSPRVCPRYNRDSRRNCGGPLLLSIHSQRLS